MGGVGTIPEQRGLSFKVCNVAAGRTQWKSLTKIPVDEATSN